MISTKPILTLCLSAVCLLSSCSKENAYQDDANQQNNLVSQQKTQQLDEVVGTYQGKMQLAQGPLDVEIDLGITQGTASQADQINKVQVPLLGGILFFPALKKMGFLAAADSFGDIVAAMGSGTALSIPFADGDFNVNSLAITLPYNSGSASFANDQVIGTFQNGVFTGEWDSHAFGKMGTFSLPRGNS